MTGHAFYLLDADLNQVGPGLLAELYLPEESLNSSYFHSARAAAERLTADPFAGPGRRMYRTGELGRQSEDGALQPVTAAGSDVEARELAQLRLALAGHPGTRHVGLSLRPGDAGARSVAAYVACESAAPTATELHELATALLPQRLIPTAIAVVSGLRLSSEPASGPGSTGLAEGRGQQPSTLPALQALFAEVLDAPDADVDDSFLDLGGQSVTAMLLIGRINAALGVELSIADLFNAPTVRALEAKVRGLRTAPTNPFDAEDAPCLALSNVDGAHCLWPAALPAPAGWAVVHGPVARGDCLDYLERAATAALSALSASYPDPAADEVAPLSFNQQFFCAMDDGAAAGSFSDRHLLVLGWRVRGPLDQATLQSALDDVVARHEILRTSIHQDRQPAYQRVHPPSPVRLEVRELAASVDQDQQAAQCEQLMTEVESRTQSVRELPLLRAVLGRLAADDHVLVLSAHHIAIDAWSMQVVIRDLAGCYAIRRGFDQALPPVRQYREYCLAQQQSTDPATLRPALDYWRTTLTGARVFTLPTRAVPVAAGASRYAMRHFSLDEELTSASLLLAKQTRSSPFMVLLSAFYLLARELTGALDLVVPTFTTGRHEARFLDTVGPFLNYLPVRTDLSGSATFTEVLARTRASCLQAYAHDIPFECIAPVAPQLLQAGPDPGSQVAFELVQPPAPVEGEAVGDLSYAEVHRRLMFEQNAPDIPDGMLWVLSLVSATEIVGTVQFKRSEFTGADVAGLVDRYRRVLRQSVTAPDERLSPPSDRAHIGVPR